MSDFETEGAEVETTEGAEPEVRDAEADEAAHEHDDQPEAE